MWWGMLRSPHQQLRDVKHTMSVNKGMNETPKCVYYVQQKQNTGMPKGGDP